MLAYEHIHILKEDWSRLCQLWSLIFPNCMLAKYKHVFKLLKNKPFLQIQWEGEIGRELFLVVNLWDFDYGSNWYDEEEFWEFGLFYFQEGFLNFTFPSWCKWPQVHEPLLCNQSRPSNRFRIRSSVFSHFSFPFPFLFLSTYTCFAA